MFRFNCYLFIFISTAFVNSSQFEKLKHRVGILVDKLIESKEFREEIELLNSNLSYADKNKYCSKCEERKDPDLTVKNYHDEVIATLALMKRTLSKEKSVARRSISKLEFDVINRFNGIQDILKDIKNEQNEIKVKQDAYYKRIEQLINQHGCEKRDSEAFRDKINKIIEETLPKHEQLLRQIKMKQEGFTHVMGNSFYYIGKESITWSQAVDTCKTLHAYLVQIEDNFEKDFLTNLAKLSFTDSHFIGVWIGGSDLQQEGLWIWEQTKSQIVFNNWGPNEPNGGRSENCLHLYKQYGWAWNDTPCQGRMGYICERKTSWYHH